LSDHTSGNIGSLVAIGKGVKVFEKHFLPVSNIRKVGDYDLSLNPKEMKIYCDQIREAYQSLGLLKKEVFKSEKKFYNNLCRSIYFSKNVKKNTLINIDDLKFIRPYNSQGIKIKDYKGIIGKKAKKNFKEFELVKKI